MVKYLDIIKELYNLLCMYDDTIEKYRKYDDDKCVKKYININKKAKKILLEKFGNEIDEYIENIKGRH